MPLRPPKVKTVLMLDGQGQPVLVQPGEHGENVEARKKQGWRVIGGHNG